MQKLLVAVVVSVVAVSCAEQQPGSPGTPGNGSTPQSTAQPLMPFRPVVGGHLLVTADKQRVVMADVEGDRLRVFDANRATLDYDVALPEKSWPTRVVEGKNGELFVLLRGAGAVATVKQQVVTVLQVCAEPRALALDAATHELNVGCAGGEVVRVSAEGAIVDTAQTGVEWRDLAVTPTGVTGTSFRAAELISLSATRQVATRLKSPAQALDPSPVKAELHQSQVAWRMVNAGARTLLIHQLHAEQLTVEGTPDAGFNNPSGGNNPYGGGGSSPPGQMVGCTNSAVVTAISTVQNGMVTSVQRTNDVLPVDAALSPDGTELAVVGAGGTGLSIYPLVAFNSTTSCLFATAGLTGLALNSVAWISPTRLVVVESLRGSPMTFDLATGLSRTFGNDSNRGSSAHSLFHEAPRGGAPLACASCHPEGGEDGHTWIIDGKARRTQTLAGGVMNRAPFHWQGDLTDLSNLMTDTFTKRMGGTPVPAEQIVSLGAWLDTIPAPKPSRVLSAELRQAGLDAFQKGQCAHCHPAAGHQEGPASDIGTGESVRAPSLLGVAARAPYLHTGEVPTLRARVNGGLHPNHGNLGALNPAEREDLIGYLESL
ncbi:MAG: c-type cytochrome [Archangium sp.]|nr:c-type cytochrome [Archangium sp.]MDP3154653.1 c-type cytochrome [Archangium sp.]MDP3572719.1 c-type cytochrome [Archangium sp.]